MIEATNSTAHIQVVDADKVVKRSKRQSQWTLLDPRTGRPVGWAIIIIIMALIVIMMMIIIMTSIIIIITIKMAALKENAMCKPSLAIDKAANQTVINFWQHRNK